jgi:glucan phosphoethanolaminetransferase (alkaline phosphatase superfamily)
MNIIHFLTQKRVLPIASFLLIISFISSSELIYHLLRHEYLNGLITFLFSLLVFLLPVFLFRKNLKLYLILLLPIFLLVPFNLAYVLYFDSKISEATVLMLINTNQNEAFELVRSYFHVLVIYIIIYLGVLYLLYRKIPSSISTKKAKYVSLFALGSLAISPLPIYLHGHDDTSYVGDLQKALFNVFPGTLIDGIQNVWHQNNFIKATEKERDKFSFFSKQDPSITDKQVHILIIGESSRYDHWGMNGYKINTTPLLSKRNDLISYSNTSSGGFMTEWAVPLLLTGVGADNYNLHIKRKGIVSAFNETGFATYWITNQTGFLGNIKIHSLEAQKGYYLLTDFRAIKNIHRDMELVDTLKKVLAQPGNKKFIVIHTLGSHYNYSARYPDQFDIIKPSNKTISSEITDKRFKNVLINSYDNSIIYTDAVIDSVINLVSRLNNFSSVTYISDHGEDLFDDDRGFTAHYHGAPPSKYDAHVPFLIWCSPKLKAAYPDKILNLVKHKNAKASSQNLIYTVTSMVGIHYPGQDSVKDLTSPGFKNNKQLIFGEYNKVYSFSDLK